MTKMRIFVALLMFGCFSQMSMAAQAPRLNFTDLTNGPDVGLGDGKGSGAIVTIWGQHLGSSKSQSAVYFIDSAGVRRPAAHHYYWTNANGQLPGGPADLYESHKMQEVAISIPDSAAGVGTLLAVVNGVESNKLPFTVRSGGIYHVKNSGSNSAAGSFSQPWKTVSQYSSGALSKHSAGDLIYSHGVVDSETTQTSSHYAVGIFTNRSPSSVNNQTAIASYPGTQSRMESYHLGFDVNETKAIVVAKYKVLTGNYAEPSSSSNTALSIYGTVSAGIKGTSDGRVVGNYVGDLPGRCPSSQSAAIVANVNSGYDYVGNLRVYGNQIEEYGCKQTSKFQHTTYFSNRWAVTLPPFELGWNYLNDNLADFGLHAYDQLGPGQSSCGNWNGPIRIHNNVVVNQRGAGIALGTNGGSPCWTNDIHVYNNILKNTGIGPDLLESGQRIAPSAFWLWGGSYTGNIYFHNNLISAFGEPTVSHDPQAAIGLSGYGDGNKIYFDNNIVMKSKSTSHWVKETSSSYGAALLDDIYGANNIFFSRSGVTSEALPSWSGSSSSSSPLISEQGAAGFTIHTASAALSGGSDKGLTHDIYGNARSGGKGIGAIVIGAQSVPLAQPNPPSLRILN